MTPDPSRALDAVDLVGVVRNLVASLKPGESVLYDEANGTAYYQHRSPEGRVLGVIWLDGDIFDNTVSDVIEPELEAMVSRGELAEGVHCSEWMRPHPGAS